MSDRPNSQPRSSPLPRRQLEPIDPDSPAGREASRLLGELFDDVAERLRREGKPDLAALFE